MNTTHRARSCVLTPSAPGWGALVRSSPQSRRSESGSPPLGDPWHAGSTGAPRRRTPAPHLRPPLPLCSLPSLSYLLSFSLIVFPGIGMHFLTVVSATASDSLRFRTAAYEAWKAGLLPASPFHRVICVLQQALPSLACTIPSVWQLVSQHSVLLSFSCSAVNGDLLTAAELPSRDNSPSAVGALLFLSLYGVSTHRVLCKSGLVMSGMGNNERGQHWTQMSNTCGDLRSCYSWIRALCC